MEDSEGDSPRAVSDAGPPPVSIEPGDVTSIDTLADLWVALASEQRAHDSHLLADANRSVIRDTLARQAVHGSIRVARCDGDAVGFITFDIERGLYEEDETRGVVQNVYVAHEHRGQGIGTALMDAAESALRDAGATVITLEAMAANRRAREFYRDRGYEPHRIQFEKSVATGAGGASTETNEAREPSRENDTHSKED